MPTTKIKTTSILLLMLMFGACQKWSDQQGTGDGRLTRPYCNNPQAVNYNWNFPGTPDSSICLFPADIFEGNFKMHDSVYNDNNDLIDTGSYLIRLHKINNTQLELLDWCSQPIKVTATRNFSATFDTLIYHGQLLCNPSDTGSALFLQRSNDTLSFSLNVWGSAGARLHRGLLTRR